MTNKKKTATQPAAEANTPLNKVLTVIGTVLCVILIPILVMALEKYNPANTKA